MACGKFFVVAVSAVVLIAYCAQEGHSQQPTTTNVRCHTRSECVGLPELRNCPDQQICCDDYTFSTAGGKVGAADQGKCTCCSTICMAAFGSAWNNKTNADAYWQGCSRTQSG